MEEQHRMAPPLMVEESNTGEVLTNLLTAAQDSLKGYQTAADALEEGRFAALLQEFAYQREQMAAELANLLLRYGGTPRESGSLTGTMHRVWINIKAAITKGDEAILAETELSEEATLEAYQEAMKEALPDDVREVVREQMSMVRLAHERILAMNAAANARSRIE
jgi:uncharacterized protein (TIGR02284 family)